MISETIYLEKEYNYICVCTVPTKKIVDFVHK